jgi:hypothetical protein
MVDNNETYYYASSYNNSSTDSVEWIVEAPASSNGSRIALADFGIVRFDHSFAKIGNYTLPIAGFGSQRITELYQINYICKNNSLDQTSPLTSDGESFTIRWLNGGSCGNVTNFTQGANQLMWSSTVAGLGKRYVRRGLQERLRGPDPKRF